MHRDPRYSAAPLAVKWNEKADCDPGGQDRGQGYLHRGFAVLPAGFFAQVLDLNPHSMLLELPSETTVHRPPALDRASSQAGA